jgi:hypothetical protein
MDRVARGQPTASRALVATADAVIHIAGRHQRSDAADSTPAMSTGTLAMLAAATASGTSASSTSRRLRRASRSCRSMAAPRPRRGARPALRPRLGDRPSARGLRPRRPRDAGAVPDGEAGLMLLPPEGALSLIHVDDLPACCSRWPSPAAPSSCVIEPDDGPPGGWSHIANSPGARPGRRAGDHALVRAGAGCSASARPPTSCSGASVPS